MRILHLLSQRPELTGSGVYVTRLIAESSSAGNENALLAGVPACCDTVPTHCVSYYPVRFGVDLPYPVVGMSDVMPYPTIRFCDMSEARLDAYESCLGRLLKSSVDEFMPDIIHTNHLWLLSSLAKRLFPSLPVVASCHGSELRQFYQCEHLQERVIEGCCALDGVLALHSRQRETIVREYGIPYKNVHVVGAGYASHVFGRGQIGVQDKNVSIKRRAQACSEFTTEKSVAEKTVVRVAYAGKIADAKGVPWLLKAMELVVSDAAARGISVVLDVCGSAPDDLVTHMEPLFIRLADHVQRHGNVSQEQLAHIFSEAAVFVLPSFYEGLPLVLLEALACECRLVATRLDGIEEVFGEMPDSVIRMVEKPAMLSVDVPQEFETDVFVSNLAKAILEQVFEEAEMRGADALLKKYTWEAVFKRVEAVYTRVVDP